MVMAAVPMLLAAGCAHSIAGSGVPAPVTTTVRTTAATTTAAPATTPADATTAPSAAAGAGEPVDLEEFLDRLRTANEQVTSTVGTFDLQGPDRSFTGYTVTQRDGVAQDWELDLTLPDDPMVPESESGVPDLLVGVRLVDGRTYLSGDGVLGPLGVPTPWVAPAADGTGGPVAQLAETFADLRHGLGPEFIDQVDLALTSVELLDNGQLEGLADTPIDVWHYQGEADPRYLIDTDPGGSAVTMDLFLDDRDRVVHAVFTQPTTYGPITGTISNSAFDSVPAIAAPDPAEVTTR